MWRFVRSIPLVGFRCSRIASLTNALISSYSPLSTSPWIFCLSSSPTLTRMVSFGVSTNAYSTPTLCSISSYILLCCSTTYHKRKRRLIIVAQCQVQNNRGSMRRKKSRPFIRSNNFVENSYFASPTGRITNLQWSSPIA